MNKFTTPDGYSYSKDEYGVIHQLNPEKFVYDPKYVSTYDKGRYALKGRALSYLRIGVLLEMYKRIFRDVPLSILDFGCGNGTFGQYAGAIVDKCYGFDILDYPLPEQIEKVSELKPADVYTFWDSLEHCPDIDFVENLECKMVVISLPWCHQNNKGSEWFEQWKHRKPNEHLHHFNSTSLIDFMQSKGWVSYHVCNIEDTIRTPVEEQENILTVIFKRSPA